MKKIESIRVLKAPLWDDVIKPAQADGLLRGHIQLTAWFAAMLFIVSLFYWLAV